MVRATIAAIALLVYVLVFGWLIYKRFKKDQESEVVEEEAKKKGVLDFDRESHSSLLRYLKVMHPRTYGKIMRHEKV